MTIERYTNAELFDRMRPRDAYRALEAALTHNQRALMAIPHPVTAQPFKKKDELYTLRDDVRGRIGTLLGAFVPRTRFVELEVGRNWGETAYEEKVQRAITLFTKYITTDPRPSRDFADTLINAAGAWRFDVYDGAGYANRNFKSIRLRADSPQSSAALLGHEFTHGAQFSSDPDSMRRPDYESIGEVLSSGVENYIARAFSAEHDDLRYHWGRTVWNIVGLADALRLVDTDAAERIHEKELPCYCHEIGYAAAVLFEAEHGAGVYRRLLHEGRIS